MTVMMEFFRFFLLPGICATSSSENRNANEGICLWHNYGVCDDVNKLNYVVLGMRGRVGSRDKSKYCYVEHMELSKRSRATNKKRFRKSERGESMGERERENEIGSGRETTTTFHFISIRYVTCFSNALSAGSANQLALPTERDAECECT